MSALVTAILFALGCFVALGAGLAVLTWACDWWDARHPEALDADALDRAWKRAKEVERE